MRDIFSRNFIITMNHRETGGREFVEAVLNRRSVRTFNGLRPDSAKMSALREFASAASRMREGDPEFLFRDCSAEIVVTAGNIADGGERLGSYGMVKGARCFAIGACSAGAAGELALGFAFERFILMCTRAGLGSCWLGATFTRGRFQRYYSAHCSEARRGLEVKAVSPVGHKAPKARWGEKIVRWAAKSDMRRGFGELFTGIQAPPAGMTEQIRRGEVSLEGMSARKLTALGLEMMRLAPSASNGQPWRADVSEREGHVHVRLRGEGTAGGFLMLDLGIGLFHLTETLRAGGVRYRCTLEMSEGKPVIEIETA